MRKSVFETNNIGFKRDGMDRINDIIFLKFLSTLTYSINEVYCTSPKRIKCIRMPYKLSTIYAILVLRSYIPMQRERGEMFKRNKLHLGAGARRYLQCHCHKTTVVDYLDCSILSNSRFGNALT